MTGIDRMVDLEIERLADGAFELRQQDGSLDEPCRVLLHPVQVRLLCERAGLIQRPAPALPRIRRDLERIRRRAVDLFELLASVPCFPPQENPSEDVTAAHDLVEAIDEVLDDIDVEPCNADVTPRPLQTAPKATKRPMTGAERVAKHRAAARANQAVLPLPEAIDGNNAQEARQ